MGETANDRIAFLLSEAVEEGITANAASEAELRLFLRASGVQKPAIFLHEDGRFAVTLIAEDHVSITFNGDRTAKMILLPARPRYVPQPTETAI